MSAGRATLPLALLLATTLAACAGVLGLRPRADHPFEHRPHTTGGINCVVCHAGAAASGEDAPIHFPTTETCTTCHSSPHDARDCNGCHGDARLRVEAALARRHLRFEHRTHVPVVHGDCVRCRPDFCFRCHAVCDRDHDLTPIDFGDDDRSDP